MPQIEIHDRRIEQKAVEQVEHAADAGEECAGILHARLALEERFNQIADDRRDALDHAEDDGVALIELRQIHLEVVGFDGAALGHIFRVEVQHHPLAMKLV